MNYEVLTNYRSESRTQHVRVAGERRSLCRAADVLNDWEALDAYDVHPEDVDSDHRCAVCYSVLERDRRAERGTEHSGSNYLGSGAGRPRTLADQLNLS